MKKREKSGCNSCNMNIIKKTISIFMSIVCIVCIAQISVIDSNAASREETVYNFLRNDMGMNHAATCAVLANIYHESGFNPTNSYTEYDGAVSYGICQWNKGRRTNLEKYLKDNGYSTDSLTGQLKFMKKELEESYSSTLKKIKGVENTSAGAYYAAYVWAVSYEGCASQYYSDRTNTAVNKYWPVYGVANSSASFSTKTNSDFKIVFVTGISETNAEIHGVFKNNTSISTDGFYIGTSESNMKKVSKNLDGKKDGATSCLSIYFGMNKWYGTLEKGTKYYYKLYYEKDGKEYTSPVNWFVTKGVKEVPSAPPVEEPVITADVNSDAAVTSDDAIYLLKYTMLPEKYPVITNVDFDKNGAVDSDDAVYLLKHTMLPEEYPIK